jgi:hypothetical protein
MRGDGPIDMVAEIAEVPAAIESDNELSRRTDMR